MIKNVMIVDDNKVDLFVTKKIIEKCNPEIKTRNFTSGGSALYFLKLCQNNGESNILDIPDLILVDINMPQMDGFQFLENLKKLKLVKKSKVYMLTSSLYSEDISRATNDSFCSGYLCKPFTVEKFASLLEEHLSTKQYKKTS